MKLLSTNENKVNVLDIWAGTGDVSKRFADLGFMVDAIDPQTWDSFLRKSKNNHSNITYSKTKIEDYIINQQYSLILLLNVIPFLEKTYVLWSLLPSLLQKLKPGGLLCIAYLVLTGGNVGNKQVRYKDLEVLESLQKASCIWSRNTKTITKHHPKHGPVSYYSRILIFKPIVI